MEIDNILISGRKESIDVCCSLFGYTELLNKLHISARYNIKHQPYEFEKICKIFNIDINNTTIPSQKTILIGFSQKYFNENIIDNYNIERIVTNKDIAKIIGDNISIKYIKCGCISSIIAKEFLNNNIIPSKQSVILLYYGIIYQTSNLKSKNTKDLDIEMVKYLKEVYKDILIEDSHNRIFEINNFRDVLYNKLDNNLIKINNMFENLYIGVICIQTINCKDIIEKNIDLICDSLERYKRKNELDFCILLMQDLEKGYSYIINPVKEYENLITRLFHFQFNNSVLEYNRVICNSEIISRLYKLSTFRDDINTLCAEKNMFFSNVRWWVNLCIASMKKIDLNQLEYGKNQPIKSKKEIIKNACNKDLYYSTFTYLVAGMEDFFSQLIKLILKKDNRRLLVTVKDINFKSKYDIENIVLANNKETIIDLIIEDRIISIMYANPRCQAEYFRKALSIDISDEKWNIWYEIKATRDLIVHNLGTINETYIEKAGTAARGKIGDTIVLDTSYFLSSIKFMKKIVSTCNTIIKDEFVFNNDFYYQEF